ncbi:hypothetical protein CHS0354_039778 [Potamilus streckersoni]|uniref:VWFA domain-containing protein n=1 Tax=Potamilus streckersoni TaxID=2493646 RepID=A0AAE0VN19_9BIVA|nr:hypothetical protein CHS0354_039778 [Potamilus streckersoni]
MNQAKNNHTVSSGHIHCARDILFIVDSSDSLGPENFGLMKNFVASVINELTIGVSESLVAIMSFSSSLVLECNLNTYDNKQTLMNAVPRIRYIGLGTNTSNALNYARTRVFTSVAGDRQGFANVVIILTDGRSGNPVQTAIEAAALHHVAKVIVIGIGPATAISELQAIATDPDQQNVLLVRDFHELQNMLKPILSVVC